MEATDLMTGDYVYNHRNWVCPVVEIHKNSAVVIARHYGEEEFLLSDLRPIPLAKEILEHNGFKWLITDQTSITYCIDNPAIHATLFKNTNEWLISIGGVGSTKERFVEVSCIRYVHELQHALRLCGIDKAIKLWEQE